LSVASDRPELLTRLAGFARLLHDAGLDAGPGRLKDATVALNHIDLRSEVDFSEALRTVFVTRKDELPIFDAAFDLYWAPPDPRVLAGAIPGKSRSIPMDPERAKAWLKALGIPESQMAREQEDRTFTASSSGYSAEEMLRQKNFDQMTWQETEEVRRLLAQSPWRLAEKRTRRLAPSRGGRIDLRRTTQRAVRSSGELVQLMHRKPRIRRRPLVLLCDVSGSMERYSRQLLLFAHAIARREEVETFVFSTRLTRITRQLRRRDVDRALDGIGLQRRHPNRRGSPRVQSEVGAASARTRRGGDPDQRWLGPRRPGPAGGGAGPAAAAVAPADLAQPPARLGGLRASDARDGRRVAPHRRVHGRAQPAVARRARPQAGVAG